MKGTSRRPRYAFRRVSRPKPAVSGRLVSLRLTLGFREKSLPLRAYDTARLTMRPLRERDFDAVHAYASMPDVVRYVDWGPNTEAETRAFLRHATAENARSPRANHFFAVTLRDTGEVIGDCDLQRLCADTAKLGWTLHPGWWGRGYGTEMGKWLLRYGFETLGLRRIVARCAAENIASAHVMEKLGMRREGCFVEARRANRLTAEPWCDELAYAMLADEWQTRCRRCSADSSTRPG